MNLTRGMAFGPACVLLGVTGSAASMVRFAVPSVIAERERCSDPHVAASDPDGTSDASETRLVTLPDSEAVFDFPFQATVIACDPARPNHEGPQC